MRTMLAAIFAGVLLVLHGAPVQAQESGNRFTITPTPEGYLKLDGKTGAVSQCRRQDSEFRCSLVPDERTALQDEIDRLTRENAELRSRLAASGAPGGPDVAKPAPAPSLPSDAEVDRALSLMERFLRRFRDIMREQDDGKPL